MEHQGSERVRWKRLLDASGATHERVFDVVCGDAELVGLWKDPEFDAAPPAFYYARVIEIPTPRWTAYDATYYGITPPAEASMTLQERAYTSPIWYSPP